MSTERCDPEIFEKGNPVCVITGPSTEIEAWVKAIATIAKARVDWHRVAGRAVVKHLGDAASLRRVKRALKRVPRGVISI
jgi:hypothetical protein